MKRDRKGILLTLATLILVILMFAEVFTYVSLNISGNRLTTQLSESESVSAIGTKAGLEIRAFLHNEMLTDIDIIDTRGISANNIANRTSTASAVKALLTGKNSTIVNMSTYINSIEQQAKIEGKNLTIVNRTLTVFQVSPLLLKATYTALAVVNVDGINSTYPINVNVTVPSASLFAQIYVGNLPPSIQYYVPITITNTQNVPTSAPFQQKVNINSSLYKAYEAGNLNNIEFFYQNYTTVPSWLESGNSNTSTNTTYWLKLAQEIPAQSSITIYMGFANMTTNLFNNLSTGEAPQLSPTYAQYDDGADVFPYYQDWGGLTALPNGWSKVNGTVITFNADNIQVAPSATASGWYGIYLNPLPSSLSSSTAAWDYYGNEYDSVAAGSYVGSSQGTPGNYAGYLFSEGDSSTNLIYLGNGGTQYAISTAHDDTNNNKIYTMLNNGVDVNMVLNYTSILPTTAATSETPTYFDIAQSNSGGSVPAPPIYVYWLRARAYPPNGVMPKVSVGSVG